MIVNSNKRLLRKKIKNKNKFSSVDLISAKAENSNPFNEDEPWNLIYENKSIEN